MNDVQSIVIMVIIVTCAFLIYLIMREFFCWYLKINERLKLEKKTLETLLKIYEQKGGDVDWKEVNKIIS